MLHEHRIQVAEYDSARARSAACRFVCSIGHDVSDPVVLRHDRESGATSGLALA